LAEWEIKISKTPIYQKNARFFIMKSIDLESVQISVEHGVWSTTYGPTRKLEDAIYRKVNSTIFLIFSVNESGGYQGFAKLMGKPDPKLKSHIFRKNNDSIQYVANFPVEWRTCLMLYPFRNLHNFPLNPLNECKTIM